METWSRRRRCRANEPQRDCFGNKPDIRTGMHLPSLRLLMKPRGSPRLFGHRAVHQLACKFRRRRRGFGGFIGERSYARGNPQALSSLRVHMFGAKVRIPASLGLDPSAPSAGWCTPSFTGTE